MLFCFIVTKVVGRCAPFREEVAPQTAALAHTTTVVVLIRRAEDFHSMHSQPFLLVSPTELRG